MPTTSYVEACYSSRRSEHVMWSRVSGFLVARFAAHSWVFLDFSGIDVWRTDYTTLLAIPLHPTSEIQLLSAYVETQKRESEIFSVISEA